MHAIQRGLDERCLAEPSKWSSPLTSSEVASLRAALNADRDGFIHSALVSVVDAIRGLRHGLYSWSTVKLYYAVFYFCRALLALESYAVVYHNKSPHLWLLSSGQMPTKRKGTSHEAVLDAYEHLNPSSILLSQPIQGVSAFKWLRKTREATNYSTPQFSEPDAPEHFLSLASIGLRRSINSYVQDDSFLYAFNEEHAMLAYPLATMKVAMKELSKVSTSQDDELITYICKLLSDDDGQIAALTRIVRLDFE